MKISLPKVQNLELVYKSYSLSSREKVTTIHPLEATINLTDKAMPVPYKQRIVKTRNHFHRWFGELSS